jgi:spore coat protein H
LLAAASLHCAGQDFTAVSDADGPDAPVSPPSEPQPPIGGGPPGAPPSVAEPPRGEQNHAPCQPRAVGGPFWLTEQETIAIRIECTTGANLPAEAFEPRRLPAGATFDAQTHSVTFSPGLDQAGVHDLEIAIAGSDDVGHIEVQVADAFDAPNNAPVDPATYTAEYGIPVVHLGTTPALNPDEYTPATIMYRGHSFEGAQAKYRGATSLFYPKKSYTLKFAKTDRFSDTVSAAGLDRKRKLTLTTTFDDNSYLRARLAFRLWNEAGAGNVQVAAFNVVVFVDGVYQGLYTLTDHIDRHLMEDNDFFEDGNLYKARTHHANFRLTTYDGAPKPTLSYGYEKTEGWPLHGEPGAYADLEDLIQWLTSSTSQSFLVEIDARVAREEYEAWWMLAGFISAGDSAGKNSYHYRDPRPGSPDGRFHCVPWDFNDSFGQSWRTTRRLPEELPPASLTQLNLIFERLLTEPATRDPLLARFRSLLDGPWAAPAIVETVDGWADEIREAAQRDESKWAAAYANHFTHRTDFTTFEQEIDYLRGWLVARHDFVRNVHLEQPLVIGESEVLDEPSSPGSPGSPDESPGSPDESPGSPDEAPGSPDPPL